ncbi:MAG: DUF4845 domain-containing protein [Acidobacteria bacterium]|nr:DUF4845 domain-containing protein [Acidobacteriota bacterium]
MPNALPRMRGAQRGGALLKAIFWTAVLVAVLYAGFKVVPIYFANYQLQDKMQTEARFAVVNRRTDEELRKIIFKEIQDQNIPARREDIKILENTQRAVRIQVDYTVPVDLKVYQFDLHFTPSAENRALY